MLDAGASVVCNPWEGTTAFHHSVRLCLLECAFPGNYLAECYQYHNIYYNQCGDCESYGLVLCKDLIYICFIAHGPFVCFLHHLLMLMASLYRSQELMRSC
jgi:hypothetical protein